MAFLAPVALLLGLLAVPIILLYMLRLRRQEQPISSILLWSELALDRAANAPWQRLRRNLLLLLQLLILAALVLALAQPFLSMPGRLNGSVIVLLDASASMQATDGENGMTRFVEALEYAEGMIAGVSANDRMTLIAVGHTPRTLVAASNDREALRAALGQAAAENAAADWPAAFALATGSTQGNVETRIVILSDGRLPAELPPLPGEVNFVPFGREDGNLAITALGARPAGETQELLVSAANFGTAPAAALLSVYVDGQLFDSRRVAIAPDEVTQQSWSLPAAGVVEARLEPLDGAADYLAVDNHAWRVMDGGAARSVLLVSEGNLFLERLFAVLPGYELARVAPDELEATLAAGDAPFDLYVLDGVPLPQPLPPGNLLVFDPQPAAAAETATIQVSGTFTNTAVSRLAGDPRLADVAWSDVHIAAARQIEAPSLETLVAAEGGPLLLAGEVDGRRVAIFPFDLAASDLPLQIAFPVIMANISGWLNPGLALASADQLRPGATVTLIPDPRAETVTVQLPDGGEWMKEIDQSPESILFAETAQTGVYTVSYRDITGDIQTTSRFDVNFLNAAESRIAPVAGLAIGLSQVAGDAAVVGGRLELWPFLLALGLLLMLLEWWVAYRRGPKRVLPRFR